MTTGEGQPREVAMLDMMADAPIGASPEEDPPSLEGGTIRSGILPSRGLLYPEGVHTDGNFSMRMMTTADEEMFGAQRSGDHTRIIDELIRRCWHRPEIKFTELLAQDKYYMLFFLRSISIDTDYRFDIKCTECSQKFRHVIVVPDGLEKRELEEGDIEPYYVDLPIGGVKLGLRHLRVKHEDQIRQQADRAYSQSTKPGAPEYTLRLAHHVVSIGDVEVPFGQARAFVKKMVSKDSLAMRNTIDKESVGLRLTINVMCPRCGEDLSMGMPWTEEFFRPRDE